MTFSTLSPSWTELADMQPRPISARLGDGYVYGVSDDAKLWRSLDAARSWQQVGSTAWCTEKATLLLPAGDGEVLIAASQSIWKTSGWGTGTITKSQKLISPTSAAFLSWGVDVTPAGKAIAVHYSTNYANSYAAWFSADCGNTWAIVRDLIATDENDQHFHFACFDPYNNNRIYLNHHSNTPPYPKDIEYSDNDGGSWTKVSRIEVIQGNTTIRRVQPTTCVPTREGFIMGSDDPFAGIYRMRRSTLEVEEFALGAQGGVPWQLNCFATYGELDPATGFVFTCFKQQTASGKGFIMASNAVEGGLVWEEPTSFPYTGQTGLSSAPGFYALAYQGDEIVATAIRPSDADPGKNVWWTFRASKPVFELDPSGLMFAIARGSRS